MRIHFICRGNAHRSVMADAYMKSLQVPGVEVISSGTVADRYRIPNQIPFRDTVSLLGEKGVGDFAKKASEQLTQERLNEEDVTIVVNQIAYDEGAEFLTFPPNTIVWDINDTGEGERMLADGDLSTKFDEDIFTQVKAHVDALVVELKLTA